MALGCDPYRPLIGFVGRLDHQKAPDDLLEVFALVASEVPEAHFVIVGDGPMRADLESRRLAGDGALAQRLSFVGEQPGTWAMSGFDVFTLPSRYEGFPYVLIEAAHLGVPIVTTAEANPRLLVDGPSHVAVGRAGHIDELAELVVKSLGLAGLPGPVDRRFTVQAMVDQTDAVYRQLIDDRISDRTDGGLDDRMDGGAADVSESSEIPGT
jgi:glycosyltransferase involved in cell wall biosynthesis